MPPKPRRRVKQPEKKKLRQKQKQRQQQNVKINVTQGGSGGGGAPIILPPQTPIQFRDTSGENVRLTGLIQGLENRIANFRPPVVAPVAEPAPNPTNDSATQTAVFNAPITYNDDLGEEVIREINQMGIKPKPIAKAPPAFNAPNDNNMSLADRIRNEANYEDMYAGQQAFKTPVKQQPELPEEPAPDYLSMGSGYVGTPVEPYINRNGKWRADVSRADLERLAQDYNIPTSGQDENGKTFKLNKEQIKSILNTRLGL
jgi:hypothetical protein